MVKHKALPAEAATPIVPCDSASAALVGRVWHEGPIAGPAIVALRGDVWVDISTVWPTVSALLDTPTPAAALREASRAAPVIGSTADLAARGQLLAPCDLHAVKAAGVTFAASLLERVVEEQAHGDPRAASVLRDRIVREIGVGLSALRPGSVESDALKTILIAQGLWSQYLEVGLGPDAELFTKCQPMAALGYGATLGIHPASMWNNPEPELVLAVNSRGKIVGATLGNDVNLRDVEGRSALLLGRAKDNNGSTAIGPFIRLLDDSFTLDDLRNAEISLRVFGEDGFFMCGQSSMRLISRDIETLVAQMIDDHHQYPDGVLLFTGTMFAPTQDRDVAGQGFTHHVGDRVEISSPRIGTLLNDVSHTNRIAPWTFGIRALMENLAARHLLPRRQQEL